MLVLWEDTIRICCPGTQVKFILGFISLTLRVRGYNNVMLAFSIRQMGTVLPANQIPWQHEIKRDLVIPQSQQPCQARRAYWHSQFSSWNSLARQGYF